jgi:hypothetical protein
LEKRQEVNTMPLLEVKDIPKEIPGDKFDEFLEKTEKDFPAEQFPEIFIQYYKDEDNVIVLGMGISGECARQTMQSLEKMPFIKGQKLQLKILRMPKIRIY